MQRISLNKTFNVALFKNSFKNLWIHTKTILHKIKIIKVMSHLFRVFRNGIIHSPVQTKHFIRIVILPKRQVYRLAQW